MKKYIYITFRFTFNSWNAQAQIEDTDLEELVIDKLSRANIIEIIKRYVTKCITITHQTTIII